MAKKSKWEGFQEVPGYMLCRQCVTNLKMYLSYGEPQKKLYTSSGYVGILPVN